LFLTQLISNFIGFDIKDKHNIIKDFGCLTPCFLARKWPRENCQRESDVKDERLEEDERSQ
jgi:hypothetical protein